MCYHPGHNLQTKDLGSGILFLAAQVRPLVPLSPCQPRASSSQVKHFHGLGKSIFSVNDSLFSQKPLRGHFLDTHLTANAERGCSCPAAGGADTLLSQMAQTPIRCRFRRWSSWQQTVKRCLSGVGVEKRLAN